MSRSRRTEVVLWSRSMSLIRERDNTPAPNIQAVVQRCAEFSERTIFRFKALGRRIETFSGTLSEIEEMVENLYRGIEGGESLPFVLITDRRDPLLTLSVIEDPLSPSQPYHKMEIFFNLKRPLVGPSSHFTFEELMVLFSRCCQGFEAATAAIYDSQLLEIVTSEITRHAIMLQLPPNEHKHIPISPIVQALPKEIVERLARLRHPLEFSTTKVPEAVFWINYWGPKQIANVGESRVRSAPWEYIDSHPSGGLILASQKEAFDALNLKHLEKLAKIADAIDLYSIQGKHLAK